jgi:hypothetical protein
VAGVSKPTDWLVTSESKKTGRSTELAELCEALGVACSGAVEETLRINGRRVTLSLRIDSGTVVGVSLKLHWESAPPSAPSIRLTKEDDADRRAKAEGISREVQLNDATFDALIYVDSHTSDDEVKAHFRDPAVRRAAQTLFEKYASDVVIDHTGVVASFKERAGLFGATTLTALLRALLEVGRAGPPRGSHRAHPGDTVFKALLVLTLPTLGAAGYVLWAFVTSHWLTAAGALAGLVAYGLSRLWIRVWVRGASSSHRTAGCLHSLLPLPLVAGGIVLLRLANCALDGSEGTVVQGTVESLQTDEDNHTSAVVKWDTGAEHRVTASSDWVVGRRVENRFYPGTLGFTWTRRR